MKLAFVIPVKELEDFALKARAIKNLGYQGAELAIQNPKKINLARIGEVINEIGLEVPAIATGSAYQKEGIFLASPEIKIRKKAIQRIKDQVEFAKNFNSLVIIGLIRGNIDGSPSGEKRLAVSLKECSRFSQIRGVRLVLEAINRYEMDFLHTLDEVEHFIRKWKIPNCGILADVFHMNIEEVSLEKAIKNAASKIWHIHLADSNRLAPGEGHIDFKSFFATIKKVDYQKYFTAEIQYLPNFLKSAELTIKYLKKYAN